MSIKSFIATAMIFGTLLGITASAAPAARFNPVWGFDIYNQVKCFPTDADGNIPGGVYSLDPNQCYYSYAWGHNAQNGNIDCFAVGTGQRFLAGTYNSEIDHCRYSFGWGPDIYGNTKCFAVGPDGSEVPNSYSVDESNCH